MTYEELKRKYNLVEKSIDIGYPHIIMTDGVYRLNYKIKNDNSIYYNNISIFRKPVMFIPTKVHIDEILKRIAWVDLYCDELYQLVT